MTRSRWHILVVLLSLFMIGGLLASAQGGPTCATGKKTDEELLQIAAHDLVHELREAAARVLADRLTTRIFEEGEYIPVSYLEELARSPTPELRGRTGGLPTFSYFEALARGELTIDELVSGTYTGETYELRLARAQAAMLALFITEILELSPEEFLEKFLQDPEALSELRLDPEIALDLLRKLENLMRGGEEKLWGYRFDGSCKAVRRAAFGVSFLIAGIDPRVPSQLHAQKEWLDLAERGETWELRWFATYVYFFIAHFAPLEPRALRDLAINGESPELRLFAAFSYLERIGDELGLDMLKDLAVHGESEELRDAASSYLVGAFFTSDISAEELYELALEGETSQLRRAAGEALGVHWMLAIEAMARDPGGLSDRELRISDIPRRSTAKAHSLEQALIIFAVENTVVHPELAQAAIGPLMVIWGGYVER